MEEQAKQEIDRLTAEIASVRQEKDNVVGELQEDRKKRQALQDKIEELQQALKESTEAASRRGDEGDVATVVKTVLQDELKQRDASRAKGNKVAALERFVSENKEFHPDNDPSGAKRDALEKAFGRFNHEGITEVDDFYSLVADAARLLGVNTTPQNSGEREVPNPYSSAGRPTIAPKAADDTDLSPAEKKLIEQNGWTKERFMKLKEKMPDFVASLTG